MKTHHILLVLFCYPLVPLSCVYFAPKVSVMKAPSTHPPIPLSTVSKFEKTRLKVDDEKKKRDEEKFKDDLSYNLLDTLPNIGQYLEGEQYAEGKKKK
jgi:hypothetical protein